MAIKNVVAQNQRHPIGADEVGADDERVGQTARLILMKVREAQAEIGAIAKEPLKQRQVLRGGDDEDLPDAREHQRRQRVVDHRLVKHRQQLFGDNRCDRIQAGTRATRQNDSFHLQITPAPTATALQ